jgi:hypothetical protein
MNRLIMMLVAFALLVGACSGAADETSDVGTAGAESEKSTAPDFTLSLEPSGEFVLSQEVKPVYMVFWAEW